RSKEAYDAARSPVLPRTPGPFRADLDRAALSHCTLKAHEDTVSDQQGCGRPRHASPGGHLPRQAPPACAFVAITNTSPTPGVSMRGTEGLRIHSPIRRCTKTGCAGVVVSRGSPASPLSSRGHAGAARAGEDKL